MQLQAGFILESVYRTLIQKFGKEKVHGLYRHLCHFNVIESNQYNYKEVNPLIYVLDNLISRGLPTYSSIFLEDIFANKIGETAEYEPGDAGFKKNKFRKTYLKNSFTKEFVEYLFNALHIVDPRISVLNLLDSSLKLDRAYGSDYEERFLKQISDEISGGYLFQLLELQTNLEQILRFSDDPDGEINDFLNGAIDSFSEQNVDFSIEFPYQINNKL